MKPYRAKSEDKSEDHAFTLLELLVLLLIVAVLATIALPTRHEGDRSSMVQCMSNQKQIVLGLTMFHEDHGGQYPWQVPATNGGSMEMIAEYHVAPHYRALSEYVGKYPKIFACPTDANRHPATNCSQLVDANLSYFLNLDTTVASKAVLGGDRHLEADGKSVSAGLFVYSAKMDLNWTRELHGNIKNGPIGVLSFGDGHVQSIKTTDLNRYFQDQLAATNRLIVP